MALLEAKKILVPGVLTKASIAFQVARLAQQEGAEVLPTSFGRQLRLTELVVHSIGCAPRLGHDGRRTDRPCRGGAALGLVPGHDRRDRARRWRRACHGQVAAQHSPGRTPAADRRGRRPAGTTRPRHAPIVRAPLQVSALIGTFVLRRPGQTNLRFSNLRHRR